MHNPNLIKVLKTNIAFVKPSQAEFVASLIKQFEAKGSLSDKQWFWVTKIAGEMLAPAAPVAKPTVGDFASVIAMFDKAATNLKKPKIALETGLPGKVSLVLANPETSKYPGTVQVLRAIGGTKEWLGRVEKDGTVTLSKKLNEAIIAKLMPALELIAKNPLGAATQYGKLTGSCCFCSKLLTDPKSVSAGYGPVCADNFGLAWGSNFLAEAA